MIAIIARSTVKLVRLTLARDPVLWALFAAAALVTAITESEIVWLFLASGAVAMIIRAPPRLGRAGAQRPSQGAYRSEQSCHDADRQERELRDQAPVVEPPAIPAARWRPSSMGEQTIRTLPHETERSPRQARRHEACRSGIDVGIVPSIDMPHPIISIVATIDINNTSSATVDVWRIRAPLARRGPTAAG